VAVAEDDMRDIVPSRRAASVNFMVFFLWNEKQVLAGAT